MIESNIIEWLDFGDSAINLDVYSKKIFLPFFRFFRILLKNKNIPIMIDHIFTLLYFFQIWTINLLNVPPEKEFLLEIINYLKKVTLLEVITNELAYKNLFLIIFLIIILDIILIIILFLINSKMMISYLALVINLLNIIIFYYLIGPTIQITLSSIWCENGNHKYLHLQCFKNSLHLTITVLSFITILLYFTISLIYSIYCNEIDLITNSNNNMARIECNYEIYCLISKASIFIFGFFFYKLDYEEEEHYMIKLIYEGFIFINCLIMSIYIYKNVYFYNDEMNKMNHFGWYLSAWFSFCIFIKTIFTLAGISNFISIGWIIIIYSIDKVYTFQENLLITESNIFELKTIKSIEMYKNILLKNLSNKNISNIKILLFGINKKFEEFIINNPEINYQYQKLINGKLLIKKFNKEDILPILSIIFILYTFYSEKLTDKNEIILHMCYFLINKFNNQAYAMLLCSKLKSTSHKYLFYKYLLTEEIKEYLIFKLNKNLNKESIKHVQISSVILYNLYINLFKIKIYDGLSSQIDYFDLLKDSSSTNKTTEHLLKCGENIFKTRKEIKEIWDKLIELNPFSDECQRDYILYLDSIVQDDFLAREETKKYILLKNNKSKEKFNTYYRMFLTNTSSVLLVDGYLSNGKILYFTQNFTFLFMYSGKELLSLTVDDLLPNCIQLFHKELINNAIKYSNIKSIFKEPKNSLLKNKNNLIYNIKLFIKPVPNLFYGLIYFSYLQKINESDFIIILDKDLKINGFSEMGQIDSSFTINNGYNLSHNILGYHIGLIIPDILLFLEYKNDEFNIIKKDYEIKGYLYPVDKIKEINNIVENILDKIKNNKIGINEGEIEDDPFNISLEYNELINELSCLKIQPFSIFFKIQLNTFIEGKYKYYRIYINNDMISENEISPTTNEMVNIIDNLKDKNQNSIYKKKNTKESKKIIKKNFEKKNQNLEDNNQNNIENSTVSRHSRHSKQLKSKQNDINEQNKSNKGKNNLNEKQEKLNELKAIDLLSLNKGKTKIPLRRCNNVRNYIIIKKQIFPIKIMVILCYIFGASIIFFITIDVYEEITSFNRLALFFENESQFNRIKINYAVLYSICVNIRWLSHSLYKNSFSHLNDEWSKFYQNLLKENLIIMDHLKKFITFIDDNYKEIVNQNYEVNLLFYKYNENKKFNYSLYNLFSYTINNGIKLMNKYDYFIKNDCKEISKELELNEVNLKNLIEVAYSIYNLNFQIFENEEEEREKSSKIKFYFPYPIILTILILICILFFYIYYTLSIHNIEIEFLDRLINFNSNNFDNYIKNLEEIKKKLRNDNIDDDVKEDDIELNDLDSKKKDEENEDGNDNIYEKKTNEIVEKKYNKKKMKNKQSKIQQQRRKKLNLMISFFRNKNIFFLVKIILILFLSSTYYLIFGYISNKNEKDLLYFDEIHDSFNKVYTDSFDIYISLKRQLDYYENNLINCNTIRNFQPMEIKKINEINIPKFGNLIMQITTISNIKKETLLKISSLYSNNACKELIEFSNEIYYCEKFWSGVLTKGIEQGITQMGVIIGAVIDELQSINNPDNNIKLLDLMVDSSFIKYEQFNEYYLFKAYNKTETIFKELRSEKIESILNLIKIILYTYIIISIILFSFLIFLVYSFNYIFSSFLNFIGILPLKYLSEDENFSNEISKFGEKYF